MSRYSRFSSSWRERIAQMLHEGSRAEALLWRLPEGFKVELSPPWVYDIEARVEKCYHGKPRALWVEDVRAVTLALSMAPKIEAVWANDLGGARLEASWITRRFRTRVQLLALSPTDCKIAPDADVEEREYRPPAKLHPECEHAFSLLDDDLGDMVADLASAL